MNSLLSADGHFIIVDGQEWFIEKLDHDRGHFYKVARRVFSTRTEFQQLDIIDVEAYGRMLILDGDPQSAEVDEFIYHECLVHPGLFALADKPDLRVLIVGAGEGASAREVLRRANVDSVVTVDVDRQVVEAIAKYLPAWHQGAFDDPRVELIISDAADFAARCRDRFDLIIFDLTCPQPGSPAEDLFGRDFFSRLKGLLAPGGVFVCQADYLDFRRRSSLLILRELERIYRTARLYSAFVPSFHCQWSFIVAADDPKAVERAFDPRERADQELLSSLKYLDRATLAALPVWPRFLAGEMNQD